MTKENEKRIKGIPGGEGWWKSSSEEKYTETFKFLVNEANISEEKAIELLSDLYWAAADCYGT